ncbi:MULTISPECIES: NUDIX hydrolase [unclassified Enterococcus]|uniref:NUDIX hydrolase n=1 Tax=unclassified Enterococcus TaxID=2608891 RepID=UPI0013ED495A|nr:MULTISPECIES: NUDIX hydrolase [unclassified Enterococcus]
MDKPVFGEKERTADYQARYAAYIVIERKNEIAVIEAPNGAFFLPGGEIEGNETKEEAVERELMEEMGIAATIGTYLGEADEYFYSNYRATYYYNPGYFFAAVKWEKIGEPTEKTNKEWWVTPEEAIQKLKRGSHRWAVEKWLREKNKLQ